MNKPLNIINIVYTINNGYSQHLVVSILSLLESNKSNQFVLYLICDSENKQIKETTDKYKNIELKTIIVNQKLFNNLIINHHFSTANYYRLLIPDVIDDDKVLYIDADTVINGDLRDLYDTELDDDYVGAVEDPIFIWHKDLKMSNDAKYFNSGMMLINNKKWKEDRLTKSVISFIEENRPVIRFVDQCGLNAVIDGKWKEVHPKFNQQTSFFNHNISDRLERFIHSELTEAKEKPTIIHYTGSSKPWHFVNDHPYKKWYWKYLRQSKYKDYKPDDINLINIIKRFTPRIVKNIFRKVIK